LLGTVPNYVDGVFSRVSGCDRTIISFRGGTLECPVQNDENFDFIDEPGSICAKNFQRASLFFAVSGN